MAPNTTNEAFGSTNQPTDARGKSLPAVKTTGNGSDSRSGGGYPPKVSGGGTSSVPSLPPLTPRSGSPRRPLTLSSAEAAPLSATPDSSAHAPADSSASKGEAAAAAADFEPPSRAPSVAVAAPRSSSNSSSARPPWPSPSPRPPTTSNGSASTAAVRKGSVSSAASRGKKSDSVEKVPMRPPVPLRIVQHLEDEEILLVEQHLRQSSLGLSSWLLLEVFQVSPAELTQQLRLQQANVPPAVTGDESDMVGSLSTASGRPKIDWTDCEVMPLNFRGCSDRYAVVLLHGAEPGGAGFVQLRLCQWNPPESIPAWSDWVRNAKQDSLDWWSRSLPPMIAGLSSPAAPQVRLAVSEKDGCSLTCSLSWQVPEVARHLLVGDRLRWQYRWREAETTTDTAKDWALSPTYECCWDDQGMCHSPWLWRPFHDAEAAECAVRFHAPRCVGWSPWSPQCAPIPMKLPAPEASGPLMLQVHRSEKDPTTVCLEWPSFRTSTCASVHQLQSVQSLEYLLELRNLEESKPCSWEEALRTKLPVTSIPGSLTWQVHGLIPRNRYEARLQVRHSQIDQTWRAEATSRFQCSNEGMGAELLQPLKPLPACAVGANDSDDAVDDAAAATITPEDLDGEIPVERAEFSQNGDFRWFPFWISAGLATWPESSLFFEWAWSEGEPAGPVPEQSPGKDVETGRAWTLAAAQRVKALPDVTDAGVGLLLSLPSQGPEVLVRCRHIAASARSAAVKLRPFIEAPVVSHCRVCIGDAGVDIEVIGRLSASGLEAADRFQVRAAMESTMLEVEDYPETTTTTSPTTLASKDLDVLKLTSDSEGNFSVRLSIEDVVVPSSAAPLAASKFTLEMRLGNGLCWSPWSKKSRPFVATVKPPQPQPGSGLVVRQLDGLSSVEVSWPPFMLDSNLSKVEYLVGITPLARPEEIMEKVVVPEAAAPAENCSTRFHRLLAGVEYVVSVLASYPTMGRFCESTDAATSSVFEIFTMTDLDSNESQPQPVVLQTPPPSLHGGSDFRSSWAWDFWLEVPHTAIPGHKAACDLPTSLLWRPAGEPNTFQEANTSVPPALLNADLTANASSQVCHFDLLAASSKSSTTNVVPPERVEFIVKILDVETKGRCDPLLWQSPVSPAWVTGFGAPPKPKAELQAASLSGAAPQVDLSFLLWESDASQAPSIPGWQVGDTEGRKPPDGHPDVPLAYGHRFATRLQVRHRLAGSDSAAVRAFELGPRSLRGEGTRIGEVDTVHNRGWTTYSLKTKVTSEAGFKDGEKHILSLRLGDDFRWSAWSAWSKPVLVSGQPTLPEVEGFEVQVIERGNVSCSWRLGAPASTPLEIGLCLKEVDQEGRDVTGREQLVMLKTLSELVERLNEEEEHGMIEEVPNVKRPEARCGCRCRAVARIGLLDHRLRYRFALFARPLFTTFGESAFREVASSPRQVWPQDEDDEVAILAVPQSLNTAESSRMVDVELESWDIPAPRPLPVTDAVEVFTRRFSGRALLFAWPEGWQIREDSPLEMEVLAALDLPGSGQDVGEGCGTEGSTQPQWCCHQL